jgi:nitrogen PTS system EIIA component
MTEYVVLKELFMAKNLITIAEAAKYLKVTDNVVAEMVNAGIFDLVKSGKISKVDKNKIDEWLHNLSEREEEQLAMKRTICRFNDYFSPEYSLLDFKADNKYEAIAEMSKFAKEIKIVKDHRWLYEVIVAREELISTAIGRQVALLHPRHMHPTRIKKPCILFGRNLDGVDFDAPDNKPVTLFFMLLMHNDKQHLFSLSYLSRFCNSDENLDRLTTAKTGEEVYHILTANMAEPIDIDED